MSRMHIAEGVTRMKGYGIFLQIRKYVAYALLVLLGMGILGSVIFSGYVMYDGYMYDDND